MDRGVPRRSFIDPLLTSVRRFQDVLVIFFCFPLFVCVCVERVKRVTVAKRKATRDTRKVCVYGFLVSTPEGVSKQDFQEEFRASYRA